MALIVLSSCNNGSELRISVCEARDVVAQADSLWYAGKMYGVDEGDSATLAQAYETLKEHTAFSRRFAEVFPFVPCSSSLCTYSHVCYHYGKLLRTKDDPVSAMQAFIDATHSHTHDYHILGRVYSNIGDICHLAGDYPLSYDMFERSADMYLKNGDTLSYYYCLNDMAIELAVQGKEDETLSILEYINNHCDDEGVHSKIAETEATLYLKTKQYDLLLSALNQNPNNYTTYYVLKAQAYEHLAQVDSAIYYAKKVMSTPYSSAQAKYNVLFILMNYDSTLSHEDLLALTALRSDIETDILTPLHNQWAMSVQLLEQDLNRKPDYRWLYAVILTMLVIGVLSLLYIRPKRRQHRLLTQQLDDLNAKRNDIQQQHEQIVHKHTEYTSNLISQLEQNCTVVFHSKDFPKNLNMNDFDAMCKIVDANFNMLATKLCYLGILNETEIRLCILVFLNANRDQISDILPYAKNGVGKLKYRVSQKMGIDGKKLRNYLLSMAVNESHDNRKMDLPTRQNT